MGRLQKLRDSFSSTQSDSVCTPLTLLQRIRRWKPIHLDPCSNPSSIVFAVVTYNIHDDGLSHDWIVPRGRLGFINPPYSDILPWMTHGWEDHIRFKSEFLYLTLSDPTTPYFDFAWNLGSMSLCKQRIEFGGMKSGASFQCMFTYFGDDKKGFRKHFGGKFGYVIR